MNKSLHHTQRAQAVNWGRAIHALLALALALAALAPVSTPAAAAKDDEPRAHPALLQLAAEHPDDVFQVILQREAKNKDLPDDDPEAAVEKAGGRVKKQLTMIESFSAELTGKEIEKLAKNPKVRWITFDAPLVSTATTSTTVRDEFTTRIYSGNNGSANWSGNWTEVQEATNPTNGAITVATINRCAGGGGYCLRLDPDPAKPLNTYVFRSVNLSGAASATLSLYRTNEFANAPGGVAGTNEEVKLQISADGGANWTTLRTYSSFNFMGAATDTFDIAAYASSTTQIRFVITKQQAGYRFLYIDNLQISYTGASAYLAAVGADRVRMEKGLNGQGVTVAVVDSGIASHGDLQGRVLVHNNQTADPDANDNYVHGTFVAGIVGANGARMGVAPGVNLINVKISNNQGVGTTADLVDGLQWINDNRAAYNIKVVNISLNSTVAESYHSNPINAAVEILWFNGITVVVAAGNNGTGSGPVTLYPPANDPFVITVGASDDKGTPALSDDTMAAFSAYGATSDGFAKPDLVAPGRSLISLLPSTNAHGYVNHPAHRVDASYFRMSGTSMSAPVVSGAVALLLQDEPGLTPDQVKYRLKATANATWPGQDAAKAGAGYLDAYAAVNGTTTQSANTGLAVSNLLTTGTNPVNSSVNWNSVNWNSVSWSSVSWSSVSWSSVNWNTVSWSSAVWDD